MPTTNITWQNLTNAIINGGGDLEKNAGANNCATNASGTGDGGARSVETITGGNWEFRCTLGPDPSGRTFVGIARGALDLDFATWDYCLHVSTESNTSGTPHPANSVFVYEGSPPNKTFRDGVWNEGKLLRIVCLNGVVRYYLDSLLLYTSSRAPVYPCYVVASLACLNKTVVDPQLITASGVGGGSCTAGSGGAEPPAEVEGSVVWDEASFFHVVEVDGVISRDPGTTGATVNRQCFAATETTIEGEGDAFEFLMPAPTTPGVVTIGLGDPGEAIDCGDEGTIHPNCGWLDEYPWFNFEFNPFGLGESKARVVRDDGTATSVFDVTAGTVYRIVLCSGKAKFFTDGTLRATSTQDPATPASLTVWVDFSEGAELSVDELISTAKKYTGVSCTTGTGGTLAGAELTENDPSTDPCAYPWTIPTPAALPLPGNGGPRPSLFQEIEGDWGEFGQTFPDGKPQHNVIQAAPIRRWLVEWPCDIDQAATLDGHYDSTRGGLSFEVTDPHTSEVITGVRYEDYSRGPHERQWAQVRSATLVKYTS